jgi:hypothetical protein
LTLIVKHMRGSQLDGTKFLKQLVKEFVNEGLDKVIFVRDADEIVSDEIIEKKHQRGVYEERDAPEIFAHLASLIFKQHLLHKLLIFLTHSSHRGHRTHRGSYLYQNICTFLNKLTQFKHFLLKLYKFVQKMTEK